MTENKTIVSLETETASIKLFSRRYTIDSLHSISDFGRTDLKHSTEGKSHSGNTEVKCSSITNSMIDGDCYIMFNSYNDDNKCVDQIEGSLATEKRPHPRQILNSDYASTGKILPTSCTPCGSTIRDHTGISNVKSISVPGDLCNENLNSESSDRTRINEQMTSYDPHEHKSYASVGKVLPESYSENGLITSLNECMLSAPIISTRTSHSSLVINHLSPSIVISLTNNVDNNSVTPTFSHMWGNHCTSGLSTINTGENSFKHERLLANNYKKDATDIKKLINDKDESFNRIHITVKERSPETMMEGKMTSSERRNPFNSETVLFNDHHFAIHEKCDEIPAVMTESKSSSESSFATLSLAELDDEVSFAELGLAEDYFSRPEGYFGLSGTEELEMAIDNCKEMIRESTVNSEKQKSLVKKLIHLRLKLQELKEGDVKDEGVRSVSGHKFKLKDSRSTKHYCEKCNCIIWGMIQFWFRCTECGYCCHDKCLNLITRVCASVKVADNPTYIMAICPERGLSVQGYRCAECRLPIGNNTRYREPRLCHYTGNYYCEMCHWNDTMVIPALVIHNWDFVAQKVSRSSKQYLKLMYERAVLPVQEMNPMLFNFVNELQDAKKYRKEFLMMKKYFLCCKSALNEKLLLQLKHRQHFVDNSDVFSLKDLCDINSDILLPEVQTIHSAFIKHIKESCEVCKLKGFICELCKEPEILFPFDNSAIMCAKCSYVLHRHCYMKRKNHCPRCERRDRRSDS